MNAGNGTRCWTSNPISARSKDRIHPQAVARAVSDAARRDAIFVFDTGLNTLWSANWIRQTGSQRIIGSFNNAAVGTALGQANGVQALDRSRQVIALTGDGGFNMLMGEFMTAVHHKLPVKVIVYNNSALGLITLEAESVGIVPFREAIEFPNPDFAALARACGGHGFTARQPGDLKAAIQRRPRRRRPGDRRRRRGRPTKCRTCRMSNSSRSGISPSPRSRKPFSPSPAGNGIRLPASACLADRATDLPSADLPS